MWRAVPHGAALKAPAIPYHQPSFHSPFGVLCASAVNLLNFRGSLAGKSVQVAPKKGVSSELHRFKKKKSKNEENS